MIDIFNSISLNNLIVSAVILNSIPFLSKPIIATFFMFPPYARYLSRIACINNLPNEIEMVKNNNANPIEVIVNL